MNTNETLDLNTIAETARTVAAEADEADTAREALEAAQADLLDLVIGAVRPALRAIGTRPRVAWSVQHHADVNYCGGVTAEERYTSRCVCLSDDRPGPVEGTPQANEGDYHGVDLFVREDGALVAFSYSGSWSRWQGSSWGWTARVTEYGAALEAIRAGWTGLDAYLEGLSVALKKAEGSREKNTERNRARAEQLAAVVSLLKRGAR